jgi:hypothetical protein
MERRTGAGEELLRRVHETVSKSAVRLLKVSDRLPEPLKKPLSAGAVRMADSTSGDAQPGAVPDAVRRVAAFAADLDRILSSFHLVKELLAVPDGRREVDVLYAGGVMGYYLFPDRRHAGLVVREHAHWRAVARDAMVPRVREAIAVFRKEKPAQLVSLPVPAGAGQ